ncbi:MAG: hypothetical protein AAGF66_01805 [Cyanobacteria bacterium P01_H01_bin.119]
MKPLGTKGQRLVQDLQALTVDAHNARSPVYKPIAVAQSCVSPV